MIPLCVYSLNEPVFLSDYIDDIHLRKFINLASLSLTHPCSYKKLTNEGIKHLSNLTSLRLPFPDKGIISDQGLKFLTNLSYLYIGGNPRETKLSDESLIHLTNLNSLEISCNEVFTDKSIMHLTKLTLLNISQNYIERRCETSCQAYFS